MIRRFFIIVLVALPLGYVSAQEIQSIDKKGIEQLVAIDSDAVHVVNFWATWCSPCVKEIGYFEELQQEYPEEILKVVLINLDFPNQVDRRVIPFIEEKGLTVDIYNMTELDYDEWIPSVDPEWSGAIPATLIFRGEKSTFLEKEITRQELFNEVKKYLN